MNINIMDVFVIIAWIGVMINVLMNMFVVIGKEFPGLEDPMSDQTDSDLEKRNKNVNGHQVPPFRQRFYQGIMIIMLKKLSWNSI